MGKRYVEVTHTYVLEVPEELQDEGLDSTVNAGVSMMEGVMSGTAKGIHNLRSDWKMMPKEYSLNFPTPVEGLETIVEASREVSRVHDGISYELPSKITRQEILDLHARELDRKQSLAMIEADADQGVSFVGDVMGQAPKITHPWDQGLRVFPLDHPMALAETIALDQENLLCGELNPLDSSISCWGVRGHEEGNHMWSSNSKFVLPTTQGEITDGG